MPAHGYRLVDIQKPDTEHHRALDVCLADLPPFDSFDASAWAARDCMEFARHEASAFTK